MRPASARAPARNALAELSMSRRAEEAYGDLESDPLVFGLLHRARAGLKATSSPKAAPLIHKIPSTSRAQNGSALFPRSGWICTLLDRTRHMHHICICIPRRTASEVRIAGAIALGDPQSWRPAALSCNPLILLSTTGTIVRARQRMTCRRRSYLLCCCRLTFAVRHRPVMSLPRTVQSRQGRCRRP